MSHTSDRLQTSIARFTDQDGIQWIPFTASGEIRHWEGMYHGIHIWISWTTDGEVVTWWVISERGTKLGKSISTANAVVDTREIVQRILADGATA
jgi:hypothetical protein